MSMEWNEAYHPYKSTNTAFLSDLYLAACGCMPCKAFLLDLTSEAEVETVRG
jgi:hypothetical protein